VRQVDPTAHLALSLANRAAALVKLKFFKEATQENILRHLANYFFTTTVNQSGLSDQCPKEIILLVQRKNTFLLSFTECRDQSKDYSY
jgi:hypothetical protein